MHHPEGHRRGDPKRAGQIAHAFGDGCGRLGKFVRDPSGAIRWGIRREGNGKLPPTMISATKPPAEDALLQKLVGESMFAPEHFDELAPTSEGYPDVDTYRTLQFYIETRP